jgi:hypothetical protein
MFFNVSSIILSDANQAGTFRHKPYGVEYRTPSPAWLASLKIIEDTFKNIEYAISYFNKGGVIKDEDYVHIYHAVNLHDENSYQIINKKYLIPYEEEERVLTA